MKIYKNHFVVLDLALNLSGGRLVLIVTLSSHQT